MSSDRTDASRQRRQVIHWKLNDAYHQASGAQSGGELRKANDMLQEVLEMMKDKSERMLHEDHEVCWQRWLEVKETAKWKRKEISDFNYGHFKNEAYKAKGWAEELPKDATQQVKDVQQAMKGRTMERWQYDEINTVLDEAWTIASAAFRRRRQEWERRHEEGQQKMRDAKARRLEAIEYRQGKISDRQYQIDKCRSMLCDARSDDFRRRVEGWIEEHYDKIREIEDQIRDLENAVRDIDSKLD
jgi:hypothetical protein